MRDYTQKRNYGCRIKSYSHVGSTFVDMENRWVRFSIWADKGADIVSAVRKDSDVDIMWRSPAGIRNPWRHIPTSESVLGNNLDVYEGGWHCAIPGGGPYQDYGMQQGIHGEATLLPWDWNVLEDHEDCIRVKMWCDLVRAPLRVTKIFTIRGNDPGIEIDSTVQNLGEAPFTLMWGEHPTFGAPFLEPGTELVIDAEHVWVSDDFATDSGLFEAGTQISWPKSIDRSGEMVDLSIIPPRGKREAEVYIFKDVSCYTIRNRKKNLQAVVQWDKTTFPYLWYWKVLNGLLEYPWFGRTYCIGLEFWNGMPNYVRAKADGQLPEIQQGECICSNFRMSIDKISS